MERKQNDHSYRRLVRIQVRVCREKNVCSRVVIKQQLSKERENFFSFL